ncbi:MAG: Uma2 family endonuclease [Pseudanabaena sp. ELA645]|jgi:Uma2 family endonuclease
MTVVTESTKEMVIAKVRWTSTDLELFPNDDTRYEIIDGELLVTRAPHWNHQTAIDNVCFALKSWSRLTKLGVIATTPGIVFSDSNNVIPDLVWVSEGRLRDILDEQGHLTAAPDLVVEVLSAGSGQERRDRELKLKLYSAQGVREYWIVDWRKKSIQVYRRENAALILVATLFENESITSPLLPNFICSLAEIFE